jgi:hypothetical protein
MRRPEIELPPVQLRPPEEILKVERQWHLPAASGPTLEGGTKSAR